MAVKPQKDVTKRVFPTFVPNSYGGEGLTKRELFAAMFVQSMAEITRVDRWHAGDRSLDGFAPLVAARAVVMADALIAELEKQDA